MPTARRGMVLPLVMAGMMLVLCIAGTLQAVSWRAGRGARTQWDAQRALYAAEYMVVQSIAEWPADMPPDVGARHERYLAEEYLPPKPKRRRK